MGLRLLAQKKEVPVKTLENNVIASKGPKLRGTKCQSVRLFDDKSLYTGIYGRGGAKIRDEPYVVNLDGDLCTRDKVVEKTVRPKSSAQK